MYVGGNPTSRVDPWGLQECSPDDLFCQFVTYHLMGAQTWLESNISQLGENPLAELTYRDNSTISTEATAAVSTTDWANIIEQLTAGYSSGVASATLSFLSSRNFYFHGNWKAQELLDVVEVIGLIENLGKGSSRIQPGFFNNIHFILYAGNNSQVNGESGYSYNERLQTNLFLSRPTTIETWVANAWWGNPASIEFERNPPNVSSYSFDLSPSNTTSLGLLILIHELGHYVDSRLGNWSANSNNVKTWGWGLRGNGIWSEPKYPTGDNSGAPSYYAIEGSIRERIQLGAFEDFAETFATAVYYFSGLGIDNAELAHDSFYAVPGFYVPDITRRCSMMDIFGRNDWFLPGENSNTCTQLKEEQPPC